MFALWYIRLYKLFVPVLRLCVNVTYYPVKYISVLFVLLVNIIKIWGRFKANVFFNQMEIRLVVGSRCLVGGGVITFLRVEFEEKSTQT